MTCCFLIAKYFCLNAVFHIFSDEMFFCNRKLLHKYNHYMTVLFERNFNHKLKIEAG